MIDVFLGAVLGAPFGYAASCWQGMLEERASRHALDRAVDRFYRKKPFESDKERLELLFERYRALTKAAT